MMEGKGTSLAATIRRWPVDITKDEKKSMEKDCDCKEGGEWGGE